MTEKYKKSRLAFFANDCSGATAIEYALIAAGISIAIVATVNSVGSQVVALFTTVAGLF
jgi:pilus assembly protein Flp/PilA